MEEMRQCKLGVLEKEMGQIFNTLIKKTLTLFPKSVGIQKYFIGLTPEEDG
jgi:hypothetical protein